jgi:hypothetical protein
MAKTNPQVECNPKPNREDFDRVLKSLLETPSTSPAAIKKATSLKGHKKLGKILNGDVHGK